MLRNIFRFTQKLFPIPLGRWQRTCENKNNIKIDWANTDHCGTCLYKKTEEKDQKQKLLEKPQEPIKQKKLL